MAVFPFTGPSYTYRSRSFDAQRSVNQYPVKSEIGTSKQVNAMVGTPGYDLFAALGPDPIRGGWNAVDRCFFVSGFTLYEMHADGTATSKGTLVTQYGPVAMSDNGLQLMLADGPNGYCLVFAANLNTVVNGTFDSDVDWTKGAGWTIGTGVATATGAITTNLSQATGVTPGVSYVVTFTMTRSAGTLTPNLGGTAGTTRSADGTYTETIVAGSNGTFAFVAAGFTGTVDVVSVTQTADQFFNITATAAGWKGADTLAFIDGYFIANKPDSGVFTPDSGIYYISHSYDGTQWNALDFATAGAATDHLVAVHAVHKQLWLLGKSTIEIAYDSGSLFPFTPISGAFIEYGCAAAQSVASSANTIFWLGADSRGQGVIWMAQGYQPQRISTNAIESAIQGYGAISDAVGFTYQEDGHYFYVLNFTNANTSWVYDIGMQQWHERSYFNLAMGSEERDRPQCHVFAFGLHLVGDYKNGNIYVQSLDKFTHNTNPIRRLRSAPHISDDLEYIYYNKFQLDMEVGVGSATGADADVNPQIALQWSDDGARTWSSEHWRPVGKVGEYAKRVIWRMLGRSRDRVFRTIYTAATRYFVIAAHIDVEQGDN